MKWVRQRKTNTVLSHFYVESGKKKLIERYIIPVVTRNRESGGWGKGLFDEGGQKIQSSSYKISKSWGCNIEHLLMIYRKVIKRVDLKSSHHKEKKSLFFMSILDDGC